MKIFLKKTGYLAILMVMVMSLSGCWALLVGAVAGAGGYAWVSGVLQKDYMEPSVVLQDAVVDAVEDLGLELSLDQRDRLTGRFRSEFTDGQSLKISVDALTEKSARLKIRCGVFGNRLRSEMVLNVIEKYL